MVDVLVGGVLYDFKQWDKEEKLKILSKIRQKIGVSHLNISFTKTSPNYFSVWKYTKK
jgi:hypothetical protein